MKRRGTRYIPYDYEAAIDKSVEDMNEVFMEYMLKTKYRCVYTCKEIRAGNQLEIEIYPEFTRKEDIPEEGRIKDKETQRNLNNKNAIKYCGRLIIENFTNDLFYYVFDSGGKGRLEHCFRTGNDAGDAAD